MEKQNELIRKFYRSDNWKIARAIKIADACGRCERCNGVGIEVHHIIHLTPANVTNPEISLNQDNLELLCKQCHNEEHGRFSADMKFDDDGNLKRYGKIKS